MEKQILIPVGDHSIYGVLHLPQHLSNEKLPTIVICHGFISNKVGQHRIFVKTAREFCKAGFAVIRFDYIGCGESTGEHENITLVNQIEETITVLDFLASYPHIDSDNFILLGHSFGGCVAANVAGVDKRVRSLILWSPVANPLEDIVGIVGKQIYQQGLAGQAVHYQGFKLGKNFFLSLSQMPPLQTITEFSGNVLIMHGSDDVETPLINASLYHHALSKRIAGKLSIEIIEGADHTYSSPMWEKATIDASLEWLTLSGAE